MPLRYNFYISLNHEIWILVHIFIFNIFILVKKEEEKIKIKGHVKGQTISICKNLSNKKDDIHMKNPRQFHKI